MKVYDEKHIKNIVLLGAPKTGKTLLAEDMIFEAGIIHRRGTIEGKNTVSDYHEIERERGNSVFATSMHTESGRSAIQVRTLSLNRGSSCS